MDEEKLPLGPFPKSILLPHFPAKWQAALWRLWGIVPPERLAKVLKAPEEVLEREAEALGLPFSPKTDPAWLERSYLTVIRSLWHIFPYSQILQVLDWTPERLLKVLMEEDFLWSKLGRLKPDTGGEVFYCPLSPSDREKTERIRRIVERNFPPGERERKDPIFSFEKRYGEGVLPDTKKAPLYSFSRRIIHSYAAGCGDVFRDIRTHDPVPEALLKAYSSLGITGIWIHAVLRDFYPAEGAEEFSLGWETRLKNLREIVERCTRYGLKLFLYFNEPRAMPMEFYEKFPSWGGWTLPDGSGRTMCTTRSGEVLSYLEKGMEFLFSQVKGLGGIFCIAMSESPTHCFYANSREKCPFCSKVPGEKILADIYCAMERGMHRAAPEAEMLACDWAWRPFRQSTDNVPFKSAVLNLLPQRIIALSVSEWGKDLHIGRVNVYLKDYSLSQVGPGEEAKGFWKHAASLGMERGAKIQMNNSWEMAAVPFLPVPYLVQEHLQNLEKEGISDLVVSWTLGGYPGGNLPLLSSSPEEIAQKLFSPFPAEKVCEAWRIFSESFRLFPFHNSSVLYRSPVNYGPKNLLYRHKTSYCATMLGFPYDDLDSWRGPYPQEVFLRQMDQLTLGWEKGLRILKSAPEKTGKEEKKALEEICNIAETVYIHLRSTFLQAAFIAERSGEAGREVLKKYAEEELLLARRMHRLAALDSRLGFEASNHYFYTLNDLKEKVLSCALLLEQLEEEI